MTFDHQRAAVLELVKGACMGQIRAEAATAAIMELFKARPEAQWVPGDAEKKPSAGQ